MNPVHTVHNTHNRVHRVQCVKGLLQHRCTALFAAGGNGVCQAAWWRRQKQPLDDPQAANTPTLAHLRPPVSPLPSSEPAGKNPDMTNCSITTNRLQLWLCKRCLSLHYHTGQ